MIKGLNNICTNKTDYKAVEDRKIYMSRHEQLCRTNVALLPVGLNC